MITVKNLCKEFKALITQESTESPIKHFFKKEYETRRVLNNISFHISQGEIVGLLGPNGAGKSTMINILAGTMLPTCGIVRVDGIDPFFGRTEYLKQIGCVFGHRTQLWAGMPVIDSFEMMKHIYKIPDKQYRENVQLFCEVLNLDSILHTHVEMLSLGQRVKADFACSMLHDPKIIYLDEATMGLDSAARERILNYIHKVNNFKKMTVLFATHNLLDMEKICSRVMIIDKGQLIYDGNLKRMKDKFASEHVMELKIDKMKVPDLQDLPVRKYKISNEDICITYDSRIISSSVILNHIIKQCHINHIKIDEPKLENIIHGIYGGPAKMICPGEDWCLCR